MASATIDIAVIGCGVSGLGAAWLASRDPRVRITLYEARTKLGGHANTVKVNIIRVFLPAACFNSVITLAEKKGQHDLHRAGYSRSCCRMSLDG